MQHVTYFPAEKVDGLFHAERHETVEPLHARCPLSGIGLSLTHSHFTGAFTLEIEAASVSPEFLYFDFPDRKGDAATFADMVNGKVNMIVAGLMVQHPKLDAKAAAWAAEADDRDLSFASDLERFERFFLFEGFDRDKARAFALTAADEKWDVSNKAPRQAFGFAAKPNDSGPVVFSSDQERDQFMANLYDFYIDQGYNLSTARALTIANLQNNDAEFDRIKLENPLPDHNDATHTYDGGEETAHASDFMRLQEYYYEAGYKSDVASALAAAEIDGDNEALERIKRENPLPDLNAPFQREP